MTLADPLTALIVEDDPNFKKVVEIRLKSWREALAIKSAASIREARALLDDKTNLFQLVILDQHLPDGMGRELLQHPNLEAAAVLAVSADDSPELPAEAVVAGAAHFLSKRQISEPLFIPLVEAILARKKLESQLLAARLRQSRLETIKVLIATLRHEINNPLGAVLGGAYLLRTQKNLGEEQSEAIRLIEASGNRIKHVLKQLCETVDLEEVQKGQEKLFQVPGDPSWGEKK